MTVLDVQKITPGRESEPFKQHAKSHNHDPHHFEWLFFPHFNGKLHLNGADYAISDHTLFLIMPGDTHKLTAKNSAEESFFYSIITESYDLNLQEELLDFQKTGLPKETGESFCGVFDDIHYQTSHPHPFMNRAANLRFLSVIYELLAADKIPPPEKEDHPNFHIRRTLEYFERNLYRPLSLKTCCKELKISEEYLIRMFKKHLDITPMKYLTDLKIRTARNLLNETTMSIKEISWKLCFTDQYHFSRTFKKHTGFSPSAFRNKIV